VPGNGEQDAVTRMANLLLQETASRNAQTKAIDRAAVAFDAERRETHDLRLLVEGWIHEARAELRAIGERLSLLDRGVQNATGSYPAHKPSKPPPPPGGLLGGVMYALGAQRTVTQVLIVLLFVAFLLFGGHLGIGAIENMVKSAPVGAVKGTP
jgi:hypothetical protein